MNETILLEQIPQGYVPSYFIYITVFVIILSIILITKIYKKNKSWGNFPSIIIFTSIISIITTLFLVVKPEITVILVTKIGEIWSNF